MSTESNIQPDPQDSQVLKLLELPVSPDNPWSDDMLGRVEIATRLTKLMLQQSIPLTVSVHGTWGTGKTFLLRRWQKDLEKEGFSAIYFNAWEDDFCDDPLLAIIGQLSEYFREGHLSNLASKLAQIAVPLLAKNVLGVLNKTTGLTLDIEVQKEYERDLLKEYREQRATKDELKKQLTTVALSVVEKTGHPLVFIIDELDRCRPTFAIELLERVKHIFDVPNLMFVFGINRDELSKSLQSVYGEIDSNVYLRRFFDFEFNLPEVESRGFAEHMIDRFQLVQVFRNLDDTLDKSTRQYRDTRFRHSHDYDNYRNVFPKLWSSLGLSLRDIDYSVRLLALLARNLPLGVFTHPYLLGVLIAMKFKSPDVYRSFVIGNFKTSEVMDYIDGEMRRDLIDEDLTRYLDRSEGFLYCADIANREDGMRGEDAHTELLGLSQGNVEFGFQVISRRAQNANPEQLSRMRQAIEDGNILKITSKVFGRLAELIDTYQMQLRR